jgi:hypothetical protein
MRGRVDSLNAATAGAIAIYELLRREGGESRRVGDNAGSECEGVLRDEDDEGT